MSLLELLAEEKELARLVAEHPRVVEHEKQINRKHDFDQIQKKASAALKAMMDEVSHTESYECNPIDALIPPIRRHVFDCLVAKHRGFDAPGNSKLAASASEGSVPEEKSTPAGSCGRSVISSTSEVEPEAKKEENRSPVLASVGNGGEPRGLTPNAPLAKEASQEENDDENPQEDIVIVKETPRPALLHASNNSLGSLVHVTQAKSSQRKPEKSTASVPINNGPLIKSFQGKPSPNEVSGPKEPPAVGTKLKSLSDSHLCNLYFKHPSRNHEYEVVNRTHASSLMLKELAMLIEFNASGGTIKWSKILQKASIPLRSFIESRRRERATLGTSPLQSIVPVNQRDAFRKLRVEFKKRRPLAESIDTSWKRRKVGSFQLTATKMPKRKDRSRKILAFKPRCGGEYFEFDENDILAGAFSGEARVYASQHGPTEDCVAHDSDADDDDVDGDFDVLKAVKRSVLADLKKQKFSRRKASLKPSGPKPIPPPTQSNRAPSQTISMTKLPKPAPRQSWKTTARQSHEPSFAERVYNLVNESSKLAPDVLCWEHDGRAFRVKDTGAKLGKLLERHFRHNKYSSFQRQLNMYGFTKHVSGKYLGCFQHEHFRIGAKESLFLIRRRGPPNRRHSFSYLGDEKKTQRSKNSHSPASLNDLKSGSQTNPIGIDEKKDDDDKGDKG